MFLKILDLVDRVCRVVVGIAFVVIVLSIFGQVFFRLVLDSHLGWAEEVSRFSFVWLTFLGSASAFKHRKHMAIDFLPEFLGQRGRVLLDTLVCLVVFALVIVLIHHGYRLTLRTMTQTAPSTGVVMGYIYIAIPLSAFLIAVNSFVDFFRNVKALSSGDFAKAAIETQIKMFERETA